MTTADLTAQLDLTLQTLQTAAKAHDLDSTIAARWHVVRCVAVATLHSDGRDVSLLDDFNRFTGEPYTGVVTDRGDGTIFTVDQLDAGPWTWALVDAGYHNIAFGVLGAADTPAQADQIVEEATQLLGNFLDGASTADMPTEDVPQPELFARL